jgi:hypothetical protein
MTKISILKPAAICSFVLLLCATAKVNALSEYYNFSADPVYEFGSTQPNASTMATAVGARLGRTITVVGSLPYENTSLQPLTADTDAPPNYIYGPAANGVIENLNLNTSIITGITSGQLRAAGTETLDTGTFNLFVLRLFTSTQYFDVFIKTTYSSYLPPSPGDQGYRDATWACYRISAPRNLNALLNISARAQALTGQNVLISGFYVSGSVSKQVLLRGIGPSLAQYGISGTMSDPTLELRNSAGTLIASNNNWQDSQSAQIQATGAQPSDYRESAIIITLTPGSYTATLQGYGGTTGVAVCEIYDLAPSADSQLVNLSSRAYIDTGNNPLIAGLIAGGTNSPGLHLIIRVLGPSLGNYGIVGPLQDPTLEVYDAYGTQIAYNNDWQDSQSAAIQATGVAPTDSRESAVVLYLQGGNYTAIARGLNNTTGVGVLDMFKLQ